MFAVSRRRWGAGAGRRAIIVLLAALIWPTGGEAQPLRLRLSTENAPEHVHTRIVQGFVDRVAGKAGDRLAVDFRHSAQLFRDADVIRALRRNQVEMAVPGLWQFDRAEPSAAVFFLPMFYGRDGAAIDAIRDGEVGAEVGRRIAETLKVRVLGRWIDLGFAHIFGRGRPIRRIEDLAGLRIRLAGGEASLRPLRAVGALPQILPWPDVPRALEAGTIDGLITTYESVDSARLDRRGIRSVYETSVYFAQYVPIISVEAWERLPADLKAVLLDCWEEGVDDARRLAAEAQASARARLVAGGLHVAVPGRDEIVEARRRFAAGEDETVRALAIDPALVRLARQALERAR